MAYEFKNRIQMDDLIKDIKRLHGKEWPKMLAKTFAELSDGANNNAKANTIRKFDIRSKWVINNIRHVPRTPSQIKMAEKSLAKHYDMFAAVFLRGATEPKYSMEFMAHHENGFRRDANQSWKSLDGEKWKASPGKGIRNKAYRTQTGKIKKRYKPGTLLEDFTWLSFYDDTRGTTVTRKHKSGRRKGVNKLPGRPFIIRGRYSRKPVIVRRVDATGPRGSNLETLYALDDKAEIKGGAWRFEENVIGFARSKMRKVVLSNTQMVVRRMNK